MKANEIKKVLEDTYVGKEYKQWDNYYNVIEVIKQIFRDIGLSDDYRVLQFKEDRSTVYFSWKEQSIGYIKAKKKKGDHHYSFLSGSYYDWTYSGFEVYLYSYNDKADEEKTIRENVALAEVEVDKANKAKDDKNKGLADLVKLMMKETGKSFNDTIWDAKAIYDLRYDRNFEDLCTQNVLTNDEQ